MVLARKMTANSIASFYDLPCEAKVRKSRA